MSQDQPSPCPSHPLTTQEEELIQSENSASIFNTLSDIPTQLEDAELLLGAAMRLAGSLTEAAVEAQRRKHLAYLIADQGQLLGTSATTTLSQVCRAWRSHLSPQHEVPVHASCCKPLPCSAPAPSPNLGPRQPWIGVSGALWEEDAEEKWKAPY